MMTREVEAALLARCIVAARVEDSLANDDREANVFRLAAMVIQSRFPRESTCLMRVSERYFAAHPNEKLHATQVIQNAWLINLPRLRNGLEQLLSE